MPSYVVDQSIDGLRELGISIDESKILIMGLTFKENCPDTRNSKVFDIISYLKEFNAETHVYDPWVYPKKNDFDQSVDLLSYPKLNYYDCIILAVAHQDFYDLGISSIRSFGKKNSIIYDLKFMFPSDKTNLRL